MWGWGLTPLSAPGPGPRAPAASPTQPTGTSAGAGQYAAACRWPASACAAVARPLSRRLLALASKHMFFCNSSLTAVNQRLDGRTAALLLRCSIKPVEPPVNNGGWPGSCQYGPGMNLIGIRLKSTLVCAPRCCSCGAWQEQHSWSSDCQPAIISRNPCPHPATGLLAVPSPAAAAAPAATVPAAGQDDVQELAVRTGRQQPGEPLRGAAGAAAAAGARRGA